jgi:hypothetical protein
MKMEYEKVNVIASEAAFDLKHLTFRGSVIISLET